MNSVDIYSINYDFVPTICNGYRSVWVSTFLPISANILPVGTKVGLISLDNKFKAPTNFKILDMVGTRIVLQPLGTGIDGRGAEWKPWIHGDGSVWGYDTRGEGRPGANRNWNFGQGKAIAKLIWN